ncbi:hypothetical protein ACFQJC_08700 [Haloferax namakaokahaiae]|uniref:Proteasome lid subunit RPN8/RPN11, contains Jab1/MPN metalloenzyme (JAMM) motif n=1 Tax=Haloferax namakaokahaiae TaxID=1748331 RepID=A0ABD5ZEL0_9EURY
MTHNTNSAGNDAPHSNRDERETSAERASGSEPPRVHITRGLVDVLLELAEENEPQSMNVVLDATAAESFEASLDLDPETPILTHFYLPSAGKSVRNVFGVDLGTPAGRGRARFLTHPQGPFRLTERDDFAAVVLLAVPPWEDDTLGAFDRSGRKLELVVVDAEPPVEEL